MRTFKITRHLEAVCESQGTRTGFRHLARLFRDGREVAKTKVCYINRTWESFDFQSVLEGLLEKAHGLSAYELKRFKFLCKNGDRKPNGEFKTIAMVAAMGSLLCNTAKSTNDFKTRILKAGLEPKGLIMPGDWNTIDEAEKTRRLDGVFKQLTA